MLPASAFPSVAFAESEVSTENGAIPINKLALEKTIEQATTYEQSLYTIISWGKFQKTLKVAQDNLMNPNLTNEIANKDSDSLLKAFDELITIDDLNKLSEEIKKVSRFSYEDYTKESHDKMMDMEQIAYYIHYDAQSKYGKAVTNSEVIAAYENLSQAILNLESLNWIDINTAEDFSEIDGSKQYILSADITGFTGNPNILTGKLDGNGHTIAFADGSKPLFQTIAKGAEVSNLGLTGNVTGGGAFAEYLGGKITNSYSWVNVDAGEYPAGGLAGQATKSGEVNITNTYVSGTVKGSVTGGLIGSKNDKSFIYFHDSYWVNIENGVSDDIASPPGEQKSIEDMKDEIFAKALNNKRGDKGVKWNRNEDGLPYFGVEAAPQDQFYPIVMKSLEGLPKSETIIYSKSEELITSIFGNNKGYVANLTLDGYNGDVEWDTEFIVDTPPVQASKDGKVRVASVGTATIIALDSTTKKEIQSFSITSEVPKKFGLTLLVNDEDLTNKEYSTPGSDDFEIIPIVKVNDGEAFAVLPSLFKWESDDRDTIRIYDDGYAEAKKVGTATITVSLGDISKTIKVTGGYTAVDTIKPTFSGEYLIHGRNPNSIGQNNTPGIASFNPLRNASGVGSEFLIAEVTPANATYAKNYTVITDNNKVLAYKGSMQNILLPLQEGTVNLTVTSNDPKKDQKSKGTTKVTIKYFNPLTSLTTKSNSLTVKKGQSIDSGLIFEGPKSDDAYHVSESGMNWTQTGTGEISAYRSYPVIMTTDAASLREGTVSNDQWLIRGVKEGTVTLTGKPVDDENGAKPVILTITVEAGEVVVEKPAKERVSEALTKTMDYQAKNIGTPTYGAEWTIFGLARAGYNAPADFYEEYYSSVIKTVEKEAAKLENRFDNSVTDTQRLALALTAIGKDPGDVGGVNLLDFNWNKEKNFPGIKPDGILGNRQGSNELIFALLAVEANDQFTQPKDASITKEQMITRLIAEYQNEDGGFGLSDNKSSSVDMTAMAIQALSKHQDMPAAKAATDKALVKLSSSQGTNGDYGSSESTSQVILALTEMGIDPQKDERFIKGGESLLDGQLQYIQEDGSFAHSFGGNGNVIATDQAFYTLVALDRFYKKKNSLYNMSDVVFDVVTGNEEVTSIKLSSSPSDLTVGNKVKLVATVLPSAADQSTTWTSSNKAIATVSDEGIVKGLTAGTATITVTSNNGKTATSVVTVVNAAPPTAEPEVKKTIGFSVETRTIGKGDIIGDTTVEIKDGDTAFTLLKRQLDAKNITIRYIGLGSTLYVQAINGLGEFDEGQGSGWMYSVNGIFPDYSAGLYKLKEGDKLRWRYTTNLGADLNNPPPITKPDPKPEVKPETPKPPVVEAPKNVETVVKDNKVEIQIKDDKTGTSKPAPIEKSETVGDFLIVQIGGKGVDIPGGLELPKGTTPKVVVIDNDKPYEYYAVKSETKANKKWDVNFSGALLNSPENLDRVTVKDASGEIVDMKVKLSADGKTVSILPSAEYEKGELYYITISDVKSASGKTLKQDIRSIFIVE